MVQISYLGDPALAFSVFFPLLLGIRWDAGVRLVGSLVISQWGSQVMKWVMHGERPYWWFHQSRMYPYDMDIIQTHITCETGPGMPSSHSQTTAIVWYALLDTWVHTQGGGWTLPSFLYWTIQLLIGLSRSFVGAHFPHQCIAGTMLGKEFKLLKVVLGDHGIWAKSKLGLF